MAEREGGSPKRRRRRRVVALSRQDEARVARGEPTQDQLEHSRSRGVDALSSALAREDRSLGTGPGGDERANDARLLAEVPPHWQ